MSPELKKEQLIELLKIHYGYNSFRPGQERVIDAVLVGKSCVVIMPTGGGKSLCYQLPALILEGVTIVISPLIALMKDQVDSLKRVGIPATFINSSISFDEARERLEKVREDQYKLLYIAPERFYNKEFMDALAGIKVSLFAVDEAHCISSWGHDFRPSYLKLRETIKRVGNPPVLALTATATPEVKEDIIKQLGLINPELVITGFSRPNLQFGAIQATDAKKPQYVLDAISGLNDESGIIYVSTRSRVDALVQTLLENNIEAVAYHAGMDSADRKWVQDNFMSGKAKVIVATNAFGLGINKANIRFVIHYDMPGTVEAYYQEAGRAGRDGKPSFCLLLYSPRDRYLQEFFIKGDNPPPEIVLDIYENLLDYPRSNTADRDGDSDSVLITYAELKKTLSDDVPEMAIGTSIKLLEKGGYLERSHEKSGQAFLKLVGSFESALESFGTRAKVQREVLEKLQGRFKNELIDGWEVNLEEVATIIGVKKDTLARLIKKLADEGMLEYTPPFKGTEIKILKRVERDKVDIDFSAMGEKLKNAYAKLNQIEEYVYNFICRQKYILDYFGDVESKLCGKCDNCLTSGGYVRKTERPVRNSFKQSHRHSTFGKQKYSGSQKTSEGSFSEENLSSKAKLSTKLTQLETFDLYKKGMNIEEMAVARELKPATIINHLCFLIEKKLPVQIDKFVSKDKQNKIKKAVGKLGKDKLTPLKEELGEGVEFDEIRLVLAGLK